VHPDDAKTEELYRKPGPAKCFALLYRGDNAIEIIRSKLGVTGTVPRTSYVRAVCRRSG
jgi:hypothetical protein